MIDDWNGLEMEIPDCEYKIDRAPSTESIPTQTSNP